jgi:hypothetical protein
VDEMTSGYKPVIEEICALNWAALDYSQLSAAAWAYYFFSVQFRENLQIALSMMNIYRVSSRKNAPPTTFRRGQTWRRQVRSSTTTSSCAGH